MFHRTSYVPAKLIIRLTGRFISKISAICVFDDAGNVIETHEHAGEFKEP
jgi:hypothetical protein